MNKNILASFISGVLITIMVTIPISSMVFAEQSGGSPESNTTSKIMQLYDSLITNDLGNESAGAWGDLGDVWNRVFSAANNSVNYEFQLLEEYDDFEGPDGSTDVDDDYQGEESVWTNTLPLTPDSKEVWRDERTGLYWSYVISTGYSTTNIFPDQNHSTCPFFDGVTDEDKIISRYNYDGLTPACGNAINMCGVLELDGNNDGTIETNWYLPSQKELSQAYINGVWNQTTATFAKRDLFWSSTELSYFPSFAYYVTFDIGTSSLKAKTSAYSVRCVSRD